MKRSQSSSNRLTERRSICPSNGGNAGFGPSDGCDSGLDGDSFGLTRPNPQASMSFQQLSLSSVQPTNAPAGKKNAQASAAGRSLLNRPKGPPGNIAICIPDNLLLDATFTACSAHTPTPLKRVSTDLTLKSCISSGSLASMMSNDPSMDALCTGGSRRIRSASVSEPLIENEEFKLTRNVSFSHEQVREYEVTLGDNPSVSSGAPVSLGWRYNPQEIISPLDKNNKNNTEKKYERSKSLSTSMGNNLMRRPPSSLKRLSDRERQRRLSLNPNVSMEDLSKALQSIAVVRNERRQSLNQLREEMVEKKRQENMILKERGYMRSRRISD